MLLLLNDSTDNTNQFLVYTYFSILCSVIVKIFCDIKLYRIWCCMLSGNLFTSTTFWLTYYESLIMYENFFYFLLLYLFLSICIRAEFNMFEWNRTWHEPNQAASQVYCLLFGLHINPPHNHSLKFFFFYTFSYTHIYFYLLYSWKFVRKAVMPIPLENILFMCTDCIHKAISVNVKALNFPSFQM
jgi:hypothetical protein